MSPVVVGLGVGVAAAVAALLRHLAGDRFNSDFPFGTLAVNLVASFALGMIVAAEDPLPIIIGVGGLGALSTWSATANEVAIMARDDQPGLAAGYLCLSMSSATLLAWFGLKFGPVLF